MINNIFENLVFNRAECLGEKKNLFVIVVYTKTLNGYHNWNYTFGPLYRMLDRKRDVNMSLAYEWRF